MQVKPILSLVSASSILLCAASIPASQLTWDPSKNGSGTAGSGNWDTNAANGVWFNGTSDIAWSQSSISSPTQGATFNGPDASPGTYTVTLDVGQVAVNSLQINNNGYTFVGSGTNGIYIGANDILSVAAGKTVTFNCTMEGSGTSPFWELGSGSTMNVGGALLTAQQLRMAGPANCAINLTGGNGTIAIPYILAPVSITTASLSTTGNFFVGYPSSGYSTGTLTIGNGGIINENGGIMIVGRAGGSGTVDLQNGGAMNVGISKVEPLAICYDNGAGTIGVVNVQGGTLSVGSGSFASQILFYDSGASASTETAVLNQTGGAINAYGGIVLGNGGGTGAIALTNAGGNLNVGPNGITKGSSYSGPFIIALSGGTLSDLSSPGWSSSLPMTLGTSGGNVTFAPGNTITLSGALTGLGGLNVSSGTLALTGANDYSGSTLVEDNGALTVATGSSPVSGAVTLDASGGSPSLTVNVTPGEAWSMGTLTTQNGGTTIGFQFGSLPPSPSVAPVQISGSVNFSTTPNLSIGGTTIAKGTYPLITYTGSVTGTLPTVTSWSGSATAGSISNNAATETIYLVVTGSSVTAPLSWGVGNGNWDFTSPNWKQSGGPADYSDGDAVIFDDSATGTSPITVTLNNTTVNPQSVTFNNNTKSYVIAGSGSGAIAGSAGISVLGNGTATLTGANTFSGGTTLGSGQLNINNGGTGSASAIGTGTLTINGGAIDNTSGADVTLQPSIGENWNGNFTYVGSANNFNTGSGGVTMNGNVTVNVNGGNFIVPGGITDNFLNYILTKSGAGTLTLGAYDQIGGGFTLTGGRVNLGDSSGSATGAGLFTINAPNGCSIDNTSGGPVTMVASGYVWTTGFEFVGSANLDLGAGTVTGNTDPQPVTVQIDTNTLSTEGVLNFGNVTVNKSGAGTWVIGGSSGNSLNLVVEAGQVHFNKTSAQAVNGTKGLTIEAGALAQDEQNFQMHSDTTGSPQTVTLQGGTWDLNGNKENVDIIAFKSGGTLENSAAGASTIDNISGLDNTLSGLSYFDVDQASGVLNLSGILAGDGTETLVKTGLGTLNLNSNCVYTGGTVISNGTLALVGVGSIADTSGIDLATNAATLDLSSNTVSQVLSLQSGQTLSGFGAIKGLLQAGAGSTVSPGSATAVGTLTVSGAGANSLAGTTTMKLSPANSTSDKLSVAGSLAYGGTLNLVNLAGTYAVGQSFALFQAGSGISGSFASITPAAPGSGLAWDLSNLGSGILAIKTGPAAPPGFSVLSLTGTTLTIHGTNGTAGQQFVLIGSTNVAAPLTSWAPLLTNSFDGSGNFNVSISATNQVEFLQLRTQ